MNWTMILGLAAGICTTAAVVPQLWKAFKTKKVSDVSPGMFFVLILGLAMWTIYGIIENDLPIILTNGTAFALNSLMLYLLFKYK
ncbi:SemiSWEET family sugar transporter [Salinimicrobium sp. GXAS 041]|uniref:SemiSWEET family sugar transporter n=1 Tax=Salinimicrobium sp. GXAS 041 TaxID=3400806 RepID=UPI003C75A382